MKKEFKDYTIKEICSYIASMNKLVEEGAVDFDVEKSFITFKYDETMKILENQNVYLKEVIENTITKLQNKENIDEIIETLKRSVE